MISRATHYAGFQSYGQKPITTLKPGQNSLERQYYDKVSGVKEEEGYLSNYDRWHSVYGSRMSDTVTPVDYLIRPRKPVFDKTGKFIVQSGQEEKTEPNPHMTSHWRTVYGGDFEGKSLNSKAKRPEWSYHQEPHKVRMPADFYRSKYS
ncbi:unnamed protein product [Blepharisma stoltei]|uniref:Uncharacterized protein n=1 Tax=Blepharisma stoltei TaxID=1481888 RepID=A0AAU9JXA2_9CILI|nr:unnamed protein product [Blepharisma stoltei]